jgi:hypothetical protein
MSAEIANLNQKITELHQSHFANSPNGLVNLSEAPNGNIIYHLYDDGEITHQKGSWAYMQRSEFSVKYPLFYGKSPYTFPKKGFDHTYAVLTESECLQMREEMSKFATSK